MPCGLRRESRKARGKAHSSGMEMGGIWSNIEAALLVLGVVVKRW